MYTAMYVMLYVYSNFEKKSVSVVSSALGNNYIVPTNIHWPIQIISNSLQKTYFVNYNNAGKVSYFMPIIIIKYIDFQETLTIDFAPLNHYLKPTSLRELGEN